MGKVVGIDLGTTNSVVAVMEGGKPVVIANAEGTRITPSVVAFTKDGERLVGQMARRQSVLNPQNTFYGIKRFLGRKYAELSPESKRVPYTIRRDEVTGNIKVKCPRLQKDFAPEEISAMVLKKLAEEASRYLGEAVTSAVITVPAYFNDAQRQATRDAGRIAGLEVMRILNEPTAASLAYGLDRRDNQTILVFDLGGGTFDVTILDIGDGVFEVKATSGDTQLGGNDFDKRIVDWLAEQFQQQQGIDLRNDRQSLQRLIEAAEKAKIELSGVSATEINLPFIAASPEGPLHLETRLTRTQFEELCTDLVNRLRQPVRQALNDAGLSPARIDEIVLVGGGSRMPMVRELVRSLIDREPNENVNPDEVVAVGAAIQAGILTQEVQDILLLDVTPLSLGLETVGGVMKKLIPRNTTIPVRRSDVFSTSENNQTMVEVHVVQGEREMANDNKSLGRFKLMGIPPAPRGIPQITVSLDIDANGILQVTALDRTTGREQGITIQGASNLSDAEIDRMIEEAERFADEDRQKRDRIEKRTKAEALTFEAERQLREVALDFGMQFASAYRRRIENLVQELRDNLKRDDDRGIDMTQADLRDAIYELQREVYQITKEDDEEKDFFGSIRRTLSNLGEEFFGDDDDFYDERYSRPDPYSRDYGNSYGRDSYGQNSYGQSNYGRDSYGQASYSREYGSRDYSNRDSSNRDYDNQDYDSRDYSPRNYDDRNYSDRSYDDQNYPDRGNERSTSSERNYGREPNRDPYSRSSFERETNDRDSYGRNSYDRDSSSRDSSSRNDAVDRPAQTSRSPENYRPENYGQPGYGQTNYTPDSYSGSRSKRSPERSGTSGNPPQSPRDAYLQKRNAQSSEPTSSYSNSGYDPNYDDDYGDNYSSEGYGNPNRPDSRPDSRPDNRTDRNRNSRGREPSVPGNYNPGYEPSSRAAAPGERRPAPPPNRYDDDEWGDEDEWL